MKKFRFLSVLLCLIMLLSRPSFAIDDKFSVRPETELNVLHIGHGEYKLSKIDKASSITDANLAGKRPLKIKRIKDDIYQILDVEALKEDKEYDKLLKVKEDTFIRVKEIKINLLDKSEIEDIISRYDVNPIMAEDIKNLFVKAQNPNSRFSKEIILYTPKRPKNATGQIATLETGIVNTVNPSTSWTRYSGPYYYTGYNDAKYMDEVFYAENVTPMHFVKQGTGTKSYITNTIKNVGEYLLDESIATVYGPQYVVAKLFFPNISDFGPYPANQDDFWQASLIEEKYKKYTSIEIYDSSANKYIYACRAIADKVYMNFNHYVYFKALMSKPDYSEDNQSIHYTKNYFSLDKKAYERMYDSIPYDESFTRWSPNKYTYFSSIN